MSQAIAPFQHPVVRAVDAVSDAIGEVPDSDPMWLTTEEKEHVLVVLAREVARLEALQLKVLAAAGDVADRHGTRHAGAWLAHATRQDSGNTTQRLAEGLGRWPVVAEAYTEGEASTAQVRVVGTALDDLPTDLDPDVRVRAEVYLVEQCRHFTPKQLRVLGRKVLDVIAPEVADAHEAKLVEAEEQHAWDHASLSHRRLGNGMSRAVVVLPDAVMDRWLTTLHAFTSPRRSSGTAPDDDRPYPRKLAHAFAELLEKIPAEWLPQHGGTTTSVVVTIDHGQLDKQLATAGLTTGTPITASEARRLACGAGILPAVLDGKGQVLDLGRTKRLYTAGQHKAMAIRDRECRAEGCDIPAAWCEAHHLEPWSRGGKTDIADGKLLCSFHHHRAHDTRYTMTRMANGDLRFHRRT